MKRGNAIMAGRCQKEHSG